MILKYHFRWSES